LAERLNFLEKKMASTNERSSAMGRCRVKAEIQAPEHPSPDTLNSTLDATRSFR
jgi:hypothetical protein